MIHEHRTMESMWNREIPLISESVSFDPNRDQIEGIRTGTSGGMISPLAFLTGPVKVTYGSGEESFVNAGLRGLIDTEKGTVRSITGELELDYRKGIFTFVSPCACGVSGFLGEEGPFRLGPVEITSDNEYLTLGVVSMDEMPLQESTGILIQSGTVYRPTGWEEVEEVYTVEDDTLTGFRIVNTGRMPWVAVPTKAVVSIDNPGIRKAYLLDMAGYSSEELPLQRTKSGIRLELPPEAVYVVLKTS